MTDQELDSLAYWQWKVILSFRWLSACYALGPLVQVLLLVSLVVVVQAMRRTYRLSRLLAVSTFQSVALAAVMLLPLVNIVCLLLLALWANKMLKLSGRQETFFLGLKSQTGGA